MDNTERERIREQFGALLDGELLPEEREAVESALAQDSELLRELDALKRVDDLYRGLPVVSAPDGFENAVRDRLRPRVLWFGQRRHTRRRVWPTALAAALFLFTSGYVIYLMQRSSSGMKIAGLPAARTEPAPRSAQIDAKDQAEPAAAPVAQPETAAQMEQLQSLGYVGSARKEGPRRAAETPGEGFGVDEAEVSPSVEEKRVERDEMAETLPRDAGMLDKAEPDDGARRDVQPVERLRSAPATAAIDEPMGRAMAQKAPPPPAAPSPAREGTEVAPADASASAESNGAAMKAGSEFVPQKAADSQARGVDGKPVGTMGPVQFFGTRREVGASKTIGPRTFVLVENTWFETGYAKEETISIQRGSAALKGLTDSDKSLTEVVELKERVVFKSGGRWYELAAESSSESNP